MVTEETPGAGDEQRNVPREQGGEAVSGREGETSAASGDPAPHRPDETRDETSGVGPGRRGDQWVRRCACCGNPLPPPTATQKKPRKYCPDGAGGYEDQFGMTCAELGPAREKVARVFGRDAASPADLNALDGQIRSLHQLLDPDSPLLTLLGRIRGTLTGVDQHLADTVADALAESARATAAATEAHGRERAALLERDTANAQAQQAVLDRQAADRDRDTQVRAAEQRATDAAAAQRRAEIAQGKADTDRDAHRDRADRADEAARIARADRDETTRTNTTLTTQVDLLTTQLHEAAYEAEQQLARADRATADAEAARVAAEEAVTAARHDAERRVDAARADLDRHTSDHTQTVQRLTETATSAAAALAAYQRRVRDGLARLQRRATAAPATPTDDPARQLEHALAAHTDLSAAVTDLATELEPD